MPDDFDTTPPQPEPGDLDPDKARLIGSIYEVVLRPEHFDAFMQDWSAYIEQAARRLGELRISNGQGSDLLADPVIETHFERAFALFERIGRGEAAAALGAQDPAPLARLARAGRVCDATDQARALFGSAPTLRSVCAALEPDSAARLQGFLATFERAPASGRFVVLSLAEDRGGATQGLPGGGLIAVVSCRDPKGDGFVAEIRPLTIGWTPALAAILVDSFQLTPRELDLVRALTEGGDLAAVASRLGKSLNTVRAQLKSVFAKTRTNAQSELMRLVSVLVLHGPIGGQNAELIPAAPMASGTEVTIDLADGRFMPVHLAGAEDGLPVVFVHGMLEGLGVIRHHDAAFRAAGLRVIAPVRANFGQAMHDPRIKDAPENFARDLGAVLDQLGVQRCIITGHMAGAVCAFAAAARLQRRIVGVANVSGCVPIKSIEQFATMTPRQRAIAYTARFAPALLPAVLRAGIARIDSRDVKRFMQPLYPVGSRDRKVIEAPEIAAAIIDGYRFTVAQGPCGFQVDSWHVTRDWSAMAARSDCPVLLIHATQDPVISLSSVRDFAQTSARISVQEIEGEGQLVFYSAPDAVLASLTRFAQAHLAMG